MPTRTADGPLVSVVIAAWNKERFLTKAIDSVLAQTYGPVEIVVVDDGSTDGTRDLAAAYGSRVRLVEQENQGAARARNVGIGHATGEFIAFLDADDVWKPEKLAKQMRVFERHPTVALVSARASLIDERGTFVCGYTDEGAGARYDQARCWHRDLLMHDNVIMTSSVVARKSALLQVGGFFDQRRIVSHDYELWIRLSEGRMFWIASEPLVYYRMLGESLLHGTTEKEYGAQLGIIGMHRHRYTTGEWRRRLGRLYCDWADSAEYSREAGAPSRLWKAVRCNPVNPNVWKLALRMVLRRAERRVVALAGG